MIKHKTRDDISLEAMERWHLNIVKFWRNNPDIRRFMREYRELTDDHLNRWYDNMVLDKNFEMFIINEHVQDDTLKCPANGKHIVGVAGLTYIDWVNKHCDVHVCGGDEWVNLYSEIALEILMDYGFNTLNMNKLWAEVYEIDEQKLNMFKKYGFKIDASLREHYYYDGKYITSHILSLLRSEFKL